MSFFDAIFQVHCLSGGFAQCNGWRVIPYNYSQYLLYITLLNLPCELGLRYMARPADATIGPSVPPFYLVL